MTKIRKDRLVKLMKEEQFNMRQVDPMYKNYEAKEIGITFLTWDRSPQADYERWHTISKVAVKEQFYIIPITSTAIGYAKVLFISEELVKDMSDYLMTLANNYDTNYWITQGNKQAEGLTDRLKSLSIVAKKVKDDMADCLVNPTTYTVNIDLLQAYKEFKSEYVRLTDDIQYSGCFTLQEVAMQVDHVQYYR